MQKQEGVSPIPLPKWLGMFYASRDGSLQDRHRLCDQVFPSYLKTCSHLRLTKATQLSLIGEPSLRTYYRWTRLQREGISFQTPAHAELMCSALDVLEEVTRQGPRAAACEFLRSPTGRVPFKRQTPLTLLLRVNPSTNWALWCLLRYPADGAALLARMRAEALRFGVSSF